MSLNALLIDPIPDRLQQTLREAVTEANGRAKARTVSDWPLDFVLQVIARHPYGGSIERTGGGVPNAYRYRAETSVLGVAWWRHPDGKLHVRVLGHRAAAPKSSYGRYEPSVFGTADPWAAVYPDRAGRLPACRVERCRRALERLGPAGEDDRFTIVDPTLVAASPDGLLIAAYQGRRPWASQVVVTDPASGLRHSMGVPVRFADRESRTYQRLMADGGETLLVRAALAWGFQLQPHEYAPVISV